MASVLIVAYLLIVIAMIVVILLQRSEGGGLGMGGGGNFMNARGSANLLTRTTGILGTLFMATAIGLTIISQTDRGTSSIFDQAVSGPGGTPASVLDALDAMGSGNDLNVPAQQAPAPQAPAAAPTDDLPVPAAPEATPQAPAGDLPVPDAAPATGN